MNKISKSEIEATFELCDEMTYEEELETVGNSFFDRLYFGTRILVLAENFGEEILVAGNMILNFAAARAEIFIAYSNEKKSTAENLAALKILGVNSDKIIFLNQKNLRADLKNILLKLRANIIFCADYDSISKNFSATFEKVMGEILRERGDYRPEIYKKLANATALNAPPDFYAPNLLSVKRPKISTTDDYNFDLIDRANYNWAGRVRFPVPEHCRNTLLKNNTLAAAIFAQKSKMKKISALRILNSDEVFFERRTDNQAFSAQISASSGAVDSVADFKIAENFWRPSVDDSEKILKFEWAEAVQVRQIKIYGNIYDEAAAKLKIRLHLENHIDKAGFSLDNVQVMENILPKRGCPLILDTEKIFVHRAEIKVVDCGKDFGISEVEFFANTEPIKKIAPFIKLAVGKNFFYRYDVPFEVEKIPLGLYKFHVEEKVKLVAKSNDETVLTEIFSGDNEIILNLGGTKEIVLTAEVLGNPNIYDKAIIRRVGDWAQIQLKVLQWLDKINLKG
ncbi:MAG: hypothetical protein IJT73_09320 [Selenomonadaceae bacterium]|nr:hypothetical protein [Selenomonadaceae bacterium]